MEIEKHIFEQFMVQRNSLKGNNQKKKKTYMELNENENKNLLPAAEIVPRGNFVVLNDGIGEGEMYQILT